MSIMLSSIEICAGEQALDLSMTGFEHVVSMIYLIG